MATFTGKRSIPWSKQLTMLLTVGPTSALGIHVSLLAAAYDVAPAWRGGDKCSRENHCIIIASLTEPREVVFQCMSSSGVPGSD